MDLMISRRRLLGAGAAVMVLGACRDSTGDATSPSSSTSIADDGRSTTSAPVGSPDTGPPTELAAEDFADVGTCRPLPEQMAGPFPLDEQFDRRDIREGSAGEPMRLGFRVVDDGCTAVAGAAVEVWHCDASGDYSAFVDGGGGKDEAGGTTFLRGTQKANDDGIVEFLSIVPGWYTGRAVHVHVRVHLDDAVVLTSQVYFDPDHLATVYASDPYAAFGPPDTTIRDDGIAGDPRTDGTLLHTSPAATSAGPGTLALLNLGLVPRRS